MKQDRTAEGQGRDQSDEKSKNTTLEGDTEMRNFLRKHNACADGYNWAVKNCKTMQDVWDTAKPEWLIWVATRPEVLSDRELHEFGLWSANQVRHLLTDPRSTAALDTKRRWLDGEATDLEIKAAAEAARAAAGTAWAAAGTAWAAAGTAWAAAGTAWAAAGTAWAAAEAAWAAAGAARAAAGAAQANWLRNNCTPSFDQAYTSERP